MIRVPRVVYPCWRIAIPDVVVYPRFVVLAVLMPANQELFLIFCHVPVSVFGAAVARNRVVRVQRENVRLPELTVILPDEALVLENALLPLRVELCPILHLLGIAPCRPQHAFQMASEGYLHYV